MKRSIMIAVFAALLGFSAHAVAFAQVDCSKIRAYNCSPLQGGDVIAGEKGSAPAGATVTVTFNGRTRTGTAARDGSFFFGIVGLGAAEGDVVTVTIGETTCEVKLERCP